LKRGEKLGGRLRQELHRFERLVLQMQKSRLDLGRVHLRFGNAQHASDEELPSVEEFGYLEALLALADEVVRAIRRGNVAHDISYGPHAVHVDGRGVLNIGAALHEHADLTLVAHGLLGGGDGSRPAESDRQHCAGGEHDIAHRHDDERVGRNRSLRGRASGGALGCRVEQMGVSHGTFLPSAT
jgi:hypothetical protein